MIKPGLMVTFTVVDTGVKVYSFGLSEEDVSLYRRLNDISDAVRSFLDVKGSDLYDCSDIDHYINLVGSDDGFLYTMRDFKVYNITSVELTEC
jgi:hypothetical protein